MLLTKLGKPIYLSLQIQMYLKFLFMSLFYLCEKFTLNITRAETASGLFLSHISTNLDQPLVPGVFFFLSFYAFCFSPTSGNLPCVKICFPQYFGITRRYMRKQEKVLGNFFLTKKKNWFLRIFSAWPAFGRGAWTNP